MRSTVVTTKAPPAGPLPDSQLVERIAALGDKTALLELDARHGLSLYAIAYGRLFDPGQADAAVATVFREVWRWAASFDARTGTVREWLATLTRSAVQHATGRGASRSET
jgi:DNA-directed RNA polymerase specialized sigma24 family protein